MTSNRNTEGQGVLINNSMQNPASFSKIYKVSLKREQQKALTLLLPKRYSFQPFKVSRSFD